MATVNRYTQYTTPRYDPLSLQEIMMVPAYKRQQHNAIEEGIAEYETALANVDPLDVHSDLAKQRQEELYNKMSEQAERLNSEGFNSAAKSDFLRLNKEYQQEVGPMGTIGKINKAKQIYEQQRADSIANAVEQGFSPEEAAANWEAHSNKYTQGFDGKNISNIEGMYAPEYVDVVARARELFKEAGGTSSDITKIGSDIVFDENLGSYVVTTKDRDGNSSNIAALQAVADYMTNQVNNPNSTVGKSIAWQRKNPKDVLSEIAGLESVYKTTSTIREDATQISNFTPKKEADVLTTSGSGLVVAGTQYSPGKFTGQTYGDLSDTISDMEAKPNKTPAEEAELYEMKKFQGIIDEELKTNETYIELNDELARVEQDINAIRTGTYDYADDPVAEFLPVSDESGVKYRDKALANKIEERNRLMSQVSDISAPIMRNAKIKVTEYKVAPNPYVSKQVTAAKEIQRQADELLRVSPQSLEQLGSITEIIDPNGDVKSIDNKEDTRGLANMLFNSKPGSISVVSHVARGASGKPEIVVRAETQEDNNYNLEGWFSTDGEYYGNVGGGKPIQMRLAFDVTKGDTGINNLLGLLQDYVASTGPVGQEFVVSQKINAMRSQYGGKNWSDVLNQNEFARNPDLKYLYRDEMSKLGINENSSDEEIESAKKRLEGKRIEI